jgi:serine/threonine protein kinase
LDKDGHCNLGDFGISRLRIFVGMKARTFIGSIPFMAPEVVQKFRYGPEVDWWSLGNVMYMMMVGDTPINIPMTAFFDEVLHKAVQCPPYLTKNAVSILNGRYFEQHNNSSSSIIISTSTTFFF